MTDHTTNLIAECMRKVERVRDEVRQDGRHLREDMRSLGRRVTRWKAQHLLVSRRLDRMDERIERIERRLDLVEG